MAAMTLHAIYIDEAGLCNAWPRAQALCLLQKATHLTGSADPQAPSPSVLRVALDTQKQSAPFLCDSFSVAVLAGTWFLVLLVATGLLETLHYRKQAAVPSHSSLSTSLLWVRIVTAAVSVSEGYCLGCMSSASVLFTAELGLSSAQAATVVGAVQLAMAIGAPVGGVLADRFGRVPTIASSFATVLVGSIVMAFAWGFNSLLLGRLLSSLGMGAGLGTVTAYMAEVSPASVRGQLVGLEELLLVLGVLLAYLVGWGFGTEWRWVLGLGGALPGFMLLSFCAKLPAESPRFLLLQGQHDEAEAALSSLAGEQEAKDVLTDWAAEALQPSVRMPWPVCIAAIGCMSAQSLAGINIMTVYTGQLADPQLRAGCSSVFTVLFGFTRLFACGLVLRYVDLLGRRWLVLCSAAGLTLVCGASAVMQWAEVSLLPWRLLGFLFYFVAYEAGLGPIMWIYASELFESAVRAKGTSLSICIARVVSGLVVLGFPEYQDRFGTTAVWLALAVCNVFIWAFVLFFLPETAGVPLESIPRLLGSGDLEG